MGRQLRTLLDFVSVLPSGGLAATAALAGKKLFLEPSIWGCKVLGLEVSVYKAVEAIFGKHNKVIICLISFAAPKHGRH